MRRRKKRREEHNTSVYTIFQDSVHCARMTYCMLHCLHHLCTVEKNILHKAIFIVISTQQLHARTIQFSSIITVVSHQPQLLLCCSSADIIKPASTFFVQFVGSFDGPLLIMHKTRCCHDSVVLA